MILLGQRPLGASDADFRLFANRSPELSRVSRSLRLGFNAYVAGSRGSGKTSFLQQVKRDHPEARYVGLNWFDTVGDRLVAIEGALTGKSEVHHRGDNFAEQVSKSFAVIGGVQIRKVADPLRHLREAAARIENETRLVLLVDDLPTEHCYELFGRLRDEMWELPVQWVVTGTAANLEAPADSFFDTVIRLPLFEVEALHELISRRADSGTPAEKVALEKVAGPVLDAVAPCTPRQALSAIRDVYLSDDFERASKELAKVGEARARLTGTAAKVLDSLMAHGPTHAGDERLLADVGVTRSRVVQVLGDLEVEGLVDSEREGRKQIYAAFPGTVISGRSAGS